MTNLIDLLLSIARSVTENIREAKKGSRERNDRLATLFDKISKCLESTSSEIRSGHIPYEQCQELGYYLQALPRAIGNRLEKEKTAALMKYLRNAEFAPLGWIAFQERMHNDLMPKSKPEKVLPKALFRKKREEQARRVAEAAGVFRGAANILRAKA